MNDKNFKRHMAYEALVILGLVALLTYITRLWLNSSRISKAMEKN